MDQRGFDNQRVVLTAAEATRALGVKRETLYAYASRGLIRTVAGKTHRTRGYLKEDVERLKVRAAARSGHAPVAAAALRWGEPVLESSITEIRAVNGPVYRGRVATALAREGASYESVAELLWSSRPRAPASSARDASVAGGSALDPTPDLRDDREGASATADMRLRGGDDRPFPRTASAAQSTTRGSPQDPGATHGSRLSPRGRGAAHSFASIQQAPRTTGERRVGGSTHDEGVTRWTTQPTSSQLKALHDVRALVPKNAHPFTALQLSLAALSAIDPLRHGATEAQDLDRARTVLPLLAASAGLGVAPGKLRAALAAPSYAETVTISLGAEPTAGTVRLIEQALIVSADHELNASAFAARVAASAGADLYACLTAALAVLTGPYHGGLTDRVEALVREARGLRRPEEVIAARLQRGEEVPGYSHPLYPLGDPRAAFLLEQTKPCRARSPELRVIFALVDAMAEAKREPPSLDLGLVAVACALKLPPGSAAALFALGRCAGWVAHALEQRQSGVLLRPRARFVPSAPVV